MSATDQQLLHPIRQMTTWELKELRQALEETLAMPTLPPHTLPREELSKTLSEVIAERDARTAGVALESQR